MKKCAKCLYFGARFEGTRNHETICKKLSSNTDKAKSLEENGIEAWPACEHDGPAYTFCVTKDFGCIHFTKG